MQAVAQALGGAGALYIVGGAVRDALLGRDSEDVDFATPLLPQEIMRRARAAGLKAVPTGIDHGTVTVVSQGRGFEVTTFRRDVKTDGRHAVVAFSEDITEDARRRDFTLNALYATLEGHLFDPLGSGIADCLARRIVFIEDAAQRIREDYLRILRFFRFHAWYADSDQGFDPDVLAAIAAHIDGLEGLSAERIGSEMRRLLAASDPGPALAAFASTGGLQRILPGATVTLLGPVIHLEALIGGAADPLLRLAALGGEAPAERLRLTRKETQILEQMGSALASTQGLAEIGYRAGPRIARAVVILRAAMSSQPLAPQIMQEIENAAQQVFPVAAADLMPAYQGAALGARLKQLETLWIASDFRMSREDLMNAL